MKQITRTHNFENRLTFVQMGRKYFYLWHEKSNNPVIALITEKGKQAFNDENWKYFEKIPKSFCLY